MDVATVTTRDGALLRAVRETLGAGDDVLLCVAFAQLRGVQLIRKELEKASSRRTPRHVHRSSAVLAILRRLPGVEPLPGRRVGLRWTGPPGSGDPR